MLAMTIHKQETGFILIFQMMVSIEFLMLVFVLRTMVMEQSKLLKEILQELLREISAMAECAWRRLVAM